MPPRFPRFNPFPGLRPFDTRDKFLFFGREAQTTELLRRLRVNRFLAVVGSSGSGKSSLVRAGVLPALHGGLMSGVGSNWRIAKMRPGGDPLGALAQALCDADLFQLETDQLGFVRATLSRSALGLTECVQQSLIPSNCSLLLVIDQFEEIFRFRTRYRTLQEEAGAFVQLLLEATRQTARPIYVVLTMRSDFLGDCAQFPGLAEAVNEGEYLIPRMKRDQYRLAIEGPVRVAGGRITARLVQRLLNDMGDNPDQLPILQHALMRTWDRWARSEAGDGPLDLRHYTDVGTMTSALSEHAEEVYEEIPEGPARWLTERMFKALTETGPDNRGVRRPTRLGELGRILDVQQDKLVPIIDRFRRPGRTFLMPSMRLPSEAFQSAAPDLASANEEADTEPDDDLANAGRDDLKPDTVIDISHESFMRVWGRLHGWVADEARSAAIYRRLADSAALWKQGRTGLIRDPELQLALDWRALNRPNAEWGNRYYEGFDDAIEFLEASAQAREAERRAVARRRQAVYAVLSLVALLLFFLWRSAAYAVQQQRTAASRGLAIQAGERVDDDPRAAVLLSLAAVDQAPTKPAVAVLRRSMFASRLLTDRLGPRQPAQNQASFSPDLKRVLSVGGTNVFVWDPQTRAARRLRREHTDRVRAGVFSPDGSLALTASWDHRAILWDTGTWEPKTELIGHTQSISRARFSADGRYAVTASRDRTARIWEVPSGRNLVTLNHGTNEVWSAAFSREGDLVATGDERGRVTLWRWREPAPIAVLDLHADSVTDLHFSIYGWLASASADSTVALSEAGPEGWQERRKLEGHAGSVLSAAFSPDGGLLTTAGTDSIVRLWDARSGRSIFTLQHPIPHAVNSVEFGPDGSSLLTACDDGYLRIWETVVSRLPVEWGPLRWVDSSPEGQYLLAGSGSNDVQVWDVRSGRMATNLVGHSQRPATGAFQRSGNLVATSGADKAVILYQRQDWARVTNLTAKGRVRKVAFSPDGKQLVATSYGRAEVWETAGWRQLTELTNHTGYVNDAAFSGDNERLATCDQDYLALVWDTQSWHLVGQSLKHDAPVNHIRFHPKDASVIVTACARRSNVGIPGRLHFWKWRKNEWQRLEAIDAHPPGVTSVLFNPSGDWLVSAGRDGRVRFWDYESRLSFGEAQLNTDETAPLISFSSTDGSLLAFGSEGLALSYPSVVWRPLDELIQAARARRLRPLDLEAF